MAAYYNEFDKHAANWLRQLIKAGLIAPGDVDDRSIVDVSHEDLAGYNQCHFFAGIGGWRHALRLAGWPDDKPVWTGSCPCQPFSTSGSRKGFDDERHLWPELMRLISKCKPDAIFGEQVEAATSGKPSWLDIVSDDLENEAYAVGASVLPACGVGSPQIRKRLFWLADSTKQRWEKGCGEEVLDKPDQAKRCADAIQPNNCGDWSIQNCRTVSFPDGSRRQIKPGIAPLANGVSQRLVRLSGYGNAIVPQVAAEFIKAAYSAVH